MQGLDRPLVFVFTITSRIANEVSRRGFDPNQPPVRCRVVFYRSPSPGTEISIVVEDPAGEMRWAPVGDSFCSVIGGVTLTSEAILWFLVRALGPFLNRPFFDDPDQPHDINLVPAFTATPNRGRVFDLGEI